MWATRGTTGGGQLAQTGRGAPLSFDAEQLMAALDRSVDAEAVSAARWLSALLDQDRGLAGRTAEGHDLAALEAAARAAPRVGDEVARLARADVAALAGERAASAGRGVASTADVAAAILVAQVSVAPTPVEPLTGQPIELAPPTAAAPPPEVDIPLSFGAEQLVASLVPAGGERGLWDLTVRLVDDHADVVGRPGIDDVSQSDWARRARAFLVASDHGAQWTRGRLAATASAHAGREHRAVVTPADVARSILEAVRATLNQEPAHAHGPVDDLGRDQDSAARTDAAEALPGPGSQPVGTDEGATSSVAAGTPTLSSPADPESGPGPGARVVRVFVSSTFRDMGAERDELVKWTFPALRKLCESRGVTWGEVDLRWGVTDEQKAEGQVLPICLAEIRGCRPYFLGLLGERYGWVPDALDPALIEQEAWLSEHVGHSVTELEILHGVLNDPAMASHAFFYLRDPAYVEGKAPDRYREVPTPGDIAAVGPQEADLRAGQRQAKLADLKERLRASGLPVREDYPDPRALGELVLADLSAVIDRLFPAGSEPDPLEREAAEHEAFAHSRGGVYIGRQDYFDRLDAHAAGDGPALVVVGESGSGKSALLANWALRHRTASPDDVVLAHFIGASPASTDWAAMVRRLIGELSRRLGFEMTIPDQPDALRLAFANALHMAAARGRVVLVLDALNQLEDREGALELAWIPPVVPANVRLVLSTLPGRSLAEIERRAFPTLAVAPLEPAERERLVVDCLASYSRALDLAPRQRIASSPQCANPLYLRALLDELRMWGEHETLGDRIDHYLTAPTVDSLYELILERYEADYERDRPHLVRDAFSLLWAARHGLTETELLDLLGTDGEPLARAHWSPLFLAAESALTSRSGMLGFFHDYLRAAVEHRYLKDEKANNVTHLRLADYFTAREVGPRKIDELPWQLTQAQAWQRLTDLLADLDFLEPAWNADQFAVKTAWAQVEANSEFRLLNAYGSVLSTPRSHGGPALSRIATLLRDTGHIKEALSLQDHLVEHYRETGDRTNLVTALGDQATVLCLRGELDEAMALFSEEERLCREIGNKAGLQESLGGRATIMGTRGELNEAMALSKERERICREIGDLVGLQESLGPQAAVLSECDRLDEAMALFKEQERICRQLGHRAWLASSLASQAFVLANQGEPDAAQTLLKQAEQMYREIGAVTSVAILLGNQAYFFRLRGQLVEALALHKEEERLLRESGAGAYLATALSNQGALMLMMGQRREALALAEEAHRLAAEQGLTAAIEEIQLLLDVLHRGR